LWIVNMRMDPDFTAIEFGDSAMLRTTLQTGVVQTAIVRRLSPAVRQALASPSTTPTPEQFTSFVITDLNRMLEDPTLWPEAQEKKWPLKQRDANLREIITRMLDKKGAFTSKTAATGETRHLLRMLNRIIIMNLIESDMWGKAIALNKLDKSQLKPLVASLEFSESWGRPLFLDKVGYELVQEHKSINYCNVWEFKRSR
jgi:hypothetical protein